MMGNRKTLRTLLLSMLCTAAICAPVYAANFKVEFNGNGGAGSMDPVSAETGSFAQLPENTFTNREQVFVNWNTAADGTGASVMNTGTVKSTVEETITLYAQWKNKDEEYTLIYNGNGATSQEPLKQALKYGQKVELFSGGFEKPGFIFNGWNTSIDGSGIQFQGGAILPGHVPGSETGTANLYAQWTAESSAKRSITVNAVWDDDRDYDGERPATWYVTLTGSNGTDIVQGITGNSYTFTDLDSTQNGQTVTYKVTAAEPYNYTVNGTATKVVSGESVSFTFVHYSETKDITVYGEFEDDDDRDGKRPDTVKLRLKGSDGRTYTAEVDVDGDEYDYEFTNLPGKKKNKTITYKLTVSSLSRYNTTVKKDNGDFRVTHRYGSSKDRITVRTVWEDNSNQRNLRPASFQVNLTGDGRTYNRSLSSGNNYSTEFLDLNTYSNGSTIRYTLKAESPQYYEATVSGSAASGFTVTQKLVSVNSSSANNPAGNSTTGTEVRPINAGTAAPGSVSASGSADAGNTNGASASGSASASANATGTGTGTNSGNTEQLKGQAFVRVVWRDGSSSDSRQNISGTLTDREGNAIPFTVPGDAKSGWNKIAVQKDTAYTLSAGDVPGYNSEINGTGSDVQYFTITYSKPAEKAEKPASGEVISSGSSDLTGTGETAAEETKVPETLPQRDGSIKADGGAKTMGITMAGSAAPEESVTLNTEAEQLRSAAADDRRLAAYNKNDNGKLKLIAIGLLSLTAIVGISAFLLGGKK